MLYGSIPTVWRADPEKEAPHDGPWDLIKFHLVDLLGLTNSELPRALIAPANAMRLARFNVENIAKQAARAAKKNITAELAEQIKQSSEYLELQQRVSHIKANMLNSLSGLFLEEAAVLIEALELIDTRILGIPKEVDGWEHTVARFGTKLGAESEPAVYNTPLAKVEALAGVLAPFIDAESWTSAQSAIHQVREADWIPLRQASATVAAVISVFGVGAWEKFALSDVPGFSHSDYTFHGDAKLVYTMYDPAVDAIHETDDLPDSPSPTPAGVMQSSPAEIDDDDDDQPVLEELDGLPRSESVSPPTSAPQTPEDDALVVDEESVNLYEDSFLDVSDDELAGVANSVDLMRPVFELYFDRSFGPSLEINGVPFARLVGRYFATNRPNAAWERTIAGDLRPRSLSSSTSSQREFMQRRKHLTACGRLIGMALRFNIVPNLALSPATLALLRTPGGEDMVKLAAREDPDAAAAIDALTRVTWDEDGNAIPPSEVEPAATPDNKSELQVYIRERKVREIVLSIYGEMALVREGAGDAIDVPYLLDLLTIEELDVALRGPTTLTPDMVLGVTAPMREDSPDWAIQIYEWFTSTVREMDRIDLELLLNFLTGYQYPPIHFDPTGRKWIQLVVESAEAREESLPTRSGWTGHLQMPRYASRAVLQAKLLEAIRPSAV